MHPTLDFGSHCLSTFEGVHLERVSPRAWSGSKSTSEGILTVSFSCHDGRWYGLVAWSPSLGATEMLGVQAWSSRYCGIRLKRKLRAVGSRVAQEQKKLNWLLA